MNHGNDLELVVSTRKERKAKHECPRRRIEIRESLLSCIDPIPWYNPAMSEMALPKVPQYRMTLFYGPEPHEEDPSALYCVFNVKKRSWKGGVQVVIEISQAQLAHIRNRFEFDQWLQASVCHLPASERKDFLERGEAILVQQVCLIKLHLAIEAGIQQANNRMPQDVLVAELDEVLGPKESWVKQEILQELDIELPA